MENKAKIKLIVADIDGTLTSNSSLSKNTRNILEEIHEQGIIFGIASGRPVYQTQRSIKAWKLKYYPDFVIGYNGAEIYNNKNQITTQHDFLTTEDIQDAFKWMKPFDDITNAFIYRDKGMLFDKNDEILIKQTKKYEGIEDVRQAINRKEMYAFPNAKIHFRLKDKNDMPKIEEYLSHNIHPFLIGVKTQPDLLEIYNKNVSKGNALYKYCRENNIDLENVAAFGDTTNDNSMLEIVGMSVCLLNGSDDTKKISKFVTKKCCNEDGFACFVKEYILDERRANG